MDKFYLSRTPRRIPSGPPEIAGKWRLVDVQRETHAPTFGLIRLDERSSREDQTTGENQEETTRIRRRKSAAIVLETLEGSAKELDVKFRETRRIQLDDFAGAIVDFDAAESIALASPSSSSSPLTTQQTHRPPDCLVLLRDASLLAVDLSRSTVQRLPTNAQDLSLAGEGKLVECHLHLHSSLDVDDDDDRDEDRRDDDSEVRATTCYVHLLGERSYHLCEFVGADRPLRLLRSHRSSSASDQQLQRSSPKFVKLLKIPSNPKSVLVQRSDLSLVYLDDRCRHLSTVCLAEDPQVRRPASHLVLSLARESSRASPAEETIVLSLLGTQLVAHSLRRRRRAFEDDVDADEDPDGLLVEEPNFEVDRCWSLDLNQLDSIRPLAGESATLAGVGSLCAVWSQHLNELDFRRSWPNFVVVAYKFHLLVYSFQRRQSFPFAFVYDRAFLSSAQKVDGRPADGEDLAVAADEQELVDMKLRPKLIHNFKLIGVHPTDSLFNNLFLAPTASVESLVQLKYFAQLGLLVAPTSSGHLLAFRFTSERIMSKPISSFQQQIADAIANSHHLLADQIEAAKIDNKQLGDKIARLVSQLHRSEDSTSGDQLARSTLSDSAFSVELLEQQEVPEFFHLAIASYRNLTPRSIVVLVYSRARVHMLRPAVELSHRSVSIYNNNSDIDSSTKLLSGRRQQSTSVVNVPQVASWAVVELDGYDSTSVGLDEISLPIFIGSDVEVRASDSVGQISVFFDLGECAQDPDEVSEVKSYLLQSYGDDVDDLRALDGAEDCAQTAAAKFIRINLELKPLMSYRLVEFASRSEDDEHLRIRLGVSGEFGRETIVHWLREFMRVPNRVYTFRLASATTACFMEVQMESDGRLELISNDLFAIEGLKRHLLDRATSNHIELKIERSPPAVSADHLVKSLGLRHNDFLVAKELERRIRTKSSSRGKLDFRERIDLTLESLRDEINLREVPSDIGGSSGWIERELRVDVELLAQNNDSSNIIHNNEGDNGKDDGNDSDNDINKLKVIVGNAKRSIIQTLVGFDKLVGANLTTNRIESSSKIMWTKLNQIMGEKSSLDRQSFVDRILDGWKESKRKI